MKSTPAMEKSYHLAIEIVALARSLAREQQEYELSRQILRSGTSIGANVAEAQGGISTADFSAKIGIAYKEGLETKFWLNLLFDTALISENRFLLLLDATDEVCRILYSILKKTRYDEQGTGNREQGTGSREQGTRNKEQRTGNPEP